MHLSTVALIILTFNICLAFAGRVLFLVPITSKSELSIFRPLALALATKGHDVTYVSSVATPESEKKGLPKTWKEVVPLDTQVTDDDFGAEGDLLDKRAHLKDKLKFILELDFSFFDELCHRVYQNAEFKEKVIRTGEYDVVITSIFGHGCFEGMFWKKGLPTIYVSSLQVPQWASRWTGFHQPLSYIPVPIFDYTDEMNFSERFFNIVMAWITDLMMDWRFNPKSEEIYKHYMGQDCPGIWERLKNVSLIFSNSHYALTLPRPLPPDIIEVGGMHCRPGNKLPKDVEDFVSGAKDGFIFFSLGTVSRGSSMPEAVRKVFVNVFGKLKQRVLWKWETETMTDLPKNVKLGKWFSQQDILAHPSIKIFITHGGLLSTQEATYHGAPLIGFPIGFDQDINLKLAEKSGYAIKLEILDITEEKLMAAINKVLSDPSYAENSRKVSSILKDQLQDPTSRAIYWTEHVMKYKGAPFLRSASRDLNYVQYHMLDVFLALSALILLVVAGLITTVCKCCCSRKNDHPSKSIRSKKDK